MSQEPSTVAAETAQQTIDYAANLRAMREQVQAICVAAGRDPSTVRVLAVSKTKPLAALQSAMEAGCTEFGENNPQELAEKASALDARFVAIGHVQRNKAKLIAEHAAEFQALDSLRLAEALQRRLELVDRTLPVLLQVNTSGEAQKHGFSPDELVAAMPQLIAFDRLQIRGLMTVAQKLVVDSATGESNEEEVRENFRTLRLLRDEIAQRYPDVCLQELSMGMSGDFPLAIEEGSTCIRVGQAIFGSRPTPPR